MATFANLVSLLTSLITLAELIIKNTKHHK